MDLLLHQIEQIVSFGRDVPLLARVFDEIIKFDGAGFQVEYQLQFFVLGDDRCGLFRQRRGKSPGQF